MQISEFDLAQLRHLYTHLMRGTDNQKSMANGLLAPVIRNVERSNG